MNKVGLISVSIHNYGSLLQTYAMQKVLDNYGLDNDIILFKSSPLKQAYRVFNRSFITMKLKLYRRKAVTKFFYPTIYAGAKKRDQAFENFKRKYCRFTPKTTSRHVLDDMGKSYRAFVLGSDQVWNPANLEMDFYTLNFVPLEKAKITYAPSFGVSEIPVKQIQKTRDYLNRIQHISVREASGAKIVKELIGRDVPVVCDPTALLTRQEWDALKSEKSFTNDQYIFCYFLGANPAHRKFAERVKKVTGCRIIALQHIDEFVPGDLKFGDITPYDVGPEDFINLIAGAEYVLTDSFHGTMFSLYYHKNFFTFPRYAQTQRNSTNSRIESILNRMELSVRFISGEEDAAEQLACAIPWENVQQKLDMFRENSVSFLECALRDSNLL